MELRPLTADLRTSVEAFVDRIPERDRGSIDAFLLYQVSVASWTRATPARRIVAVDDDNEILGVVSVIPRTGWQCHVGEFRVLVDPSARGRGVGRRLIEHGIELARQLDLLKLTVEIMASNASGRALFEQFGFTLEASLARHVRDGEGNLQDLVLLGREL